MFVECLFSQKRPFLRSLANIYTLPSFLSHLHMLRTKQRASSLLSPFLPHSLFRRFCSAFNKDDPLVSFLKKKKQRRLLEFTNTQEFRGPRKTSIELKRKSSLLTTTSGGLDIHIQSRDYVC